MHIVSYQLVFIIRIIIHKYFSSSDPDRMIIKLMFLVSQAGFIISQPRIIPGELGTLVLTQEIYPEDYLYEYVENE